MFSRSSIIVAALAVLASTAPLNINLGAYSPALVVGDGEIGFEGGATNVANLMNTLQGAAVNGANAGAANGAAAAPAPAAAAPAAAKRAPEPEEQVPAIQRRQNGFDRALQFAEAALTKGPKVQLGTGKGGAGVGIIVDNNPTAAARPGTGGAAEGAARPAPAPEAAGGGVATVTATVVAGQPTPATTAAPAAE